MSYDEACIVIVHTMQMKYLADAGHQTSAASWTVHELVQHLGLSQEQAIDVIQAAFRHMNRWDDAERLLKLSAVALEGRPS
jgi:hypothetical protein